MRIRRSVILSLSFLLGAYNFTHAQSSSDLLTIADRVVSRIQSQNPNWKYENVEPITGGTDVIVQQWTLDNRSIRIAIISHRTSTDASAALSKLAREGQLNERVQGLADAGMTWGRGVVSFRKRNLTIDVSATNTEPTLDIKQAAKNTTDERKLAKEFAQLVADAIKDKQ